jgi:integrase
MGEISCPQCGSKRLYKAGLRYLITGEAVQRWLCRECGYRFTPPEKPDSATKMKSKPINCPNHYNMNRRVCELLQESKNLTETTRQEIAQREGTAAHLTSQLLDYAWQAKKRGLAESTIKQRVYKLRALAKEGADLSNPDSVLEALARSTWTQAHKRTIIIAYTSYTKTYHLRWEPPKTRVERKIPYIPTEQEISQLIAGCGRKTATLLQVLKDTAARTSEATKLKWTDVDEKKLTIRINNPVKGSLARIVKVTSATIAMLNQMPKTSEYIFNTNADTVRKCFTKQRNRIARTLQNPKLKLIHLHTLRHWKATMEYHRTKNIKHVQQMLGHKKIENTDLYTQLLNFESDEWHVATAKNLEEEGKLIEAGFDYVRYSEKDEVAIYRKRK